MFVSMKRQLSFTSLLLGHRSLWSSNIMLRPVHVWPHPGPDAASNVALSQPPASHALYLGADASLHTSNCSFLSSTDCQLSFHFFSCTSFLCFLLFAASTAGLLIIMQLTQSVSSSSCSAQPHVPPPLLSSEPAPPQGKDKVQIWRKYYHVCLDNTESHTHTAS